MALRSRKQVVQREFSRRPDPRRTNVVIGEPSGTPRGKESTEAVNEPAADQRDHARDKAPVIYDVVSHLKKVPARLSIYDALCLSKKYREMLLNALLDQEARKVMMAEIESEMEEMKITGIEGRPVEQSCRLTDRL